MKVIHYKVIDRATDADIESDSITVTAPRQWAADQRAEFPQWDFSVWDDDGNTY